jgi:23S rRNA pseudouridine1911/1915/1917 synthase
MFSMSLAPVLPPTTLPPVLYEDADLLIVNKPAGLVVHPAYKHPSDTLVDAVFARQAAHLEPRPWLLHRLDRDTSGVVAFAKSLRARVSLTRQFERRTIEKRYLAVTSGVPEPACDFIDAPLRRDTADRRRTVVAADGQPAETWYQVLASEQGYALVLVRPLTGRTHQIRVHLASRGTPVAGDICYDEHHERRTHLAPRVMLHAWQLACTHPATDSLFRALAPVPPDMCQYMDVVGLESLTGVADI